LKIVVQREIFFCKIIFIRCDDRDIMPSGGEFQDAFPNQRISISFTRLAEWFPSRQVSTNEDVMRRVRYRLNLTAMADDRISKLAVVRLNVRPKVIGRIVDLELSPSEVLHRPGCAKKFGPPLFNTLSVPVYHFPDDDLWDNKLMPSYRAVLN
jgi:hypothetical protein